MGLGAPDRASSGAPGPQWPRFKAEAFTPFRPMLATLLLCAAPQNALALERILPPSAGLTRPTDLQTRPGDGALVVAEQGGLIRIVEGGAIRSAPMLDLSNVVTTVGDVGLRCLAFHPNYLVNGQVFVWYDVDDGSGVAVEGVLERYERDANDPNRLDPSTAFEILRVPQDGLSHGGGSIHFDASGMLNLGIGDGKPGNDEFCRGQDPSDLQGSMIRIDVDGGTPYAIPADNPYVSIPWIRSEIIHIGLRHPWKWSFDPVTGDTWIADVGAQSREEIDFVPAGVYGLNFGWNVMEGTTCYTDGNCPTPNGPCGDPVYTDPVFEYDHTLGCSVTGGAVYRGTALPGMVGRYVFADFCTNRIWSTGPDGQGGFNTIEHAVTLYPAGTNLVLTTAIGTDADGEILVSDYIDGSIYRIAPVENVQPLCDGAVNGVGKHAVLTAIGTTSLSANALSFRVIDAPPQSLSLLFYGPEAVSVPAGNGTRCVGGGGLSIFRLDYRVSSPAGQIDHPVDFTSFDLSSGPGALQAGTTWYFQNWHRDVLLQGGAGTNYSSAVAVRFRP